jgi:TPR repeat protein
MKPARLLRSFAFGLAMSVAIQSGVAHSQGKVPELDRPLDALTSAAEAGDANAQLMLGLYLQHSKPMLDGSSPDYSRIVDLYRRAERQGNIGASFALGRLYDQGLGVEKDLNQAIDHYSVAAKAGNPEAMGYMASSYFWIGDYSFSFIWADRAAQAGDPGGTNVLAVLYNKGWGGADKDYSKAMELYRRAADAGDCFALSNIGGLYYNGDGVAQNASEAERWFAKAQNCKSDEAAFLARHTDKYLDNIRSGSLPDPEPRTPSSAELVAGALVIAAIAAAGTAASSDGSSGGGDGPPPGEWKADFWCKTDFSDPDPVNKPTLCTHRNGGVWDRSAAFDPCSGVDGWCDGYGLGPKPGFLQ